MVKRKVIKAFENLSPEVMAALNESYPYGFEDKIQSIQDVIKGGFFKGLIFDHDDVTYLIKFKNEEQITGFPTEDDSDDDDNNYDDDSVGYDADSIADDSYDD